VKILIDGQRLVLLLLHTWMSKPYVDLLVTSDYIIREFNENIDPIELMWHCDNEDRLVEIIGETNWKIQLDNKLPLSMDKPIFIPAMS